MSVLARDPPTASPTRHLWGLAAVLASGVMAACAALEPLHPGPEVALVETGHRLAVSECSACHMVGTGGGAPATGAPSFATIAERYRNYRLDWELETISQVGHYRMPPKMLTSPEIDALTAYIRTLDTAKPSRVQTPSVR
ncbi:cytochrome c [Caulobacter sp. UNC279MFTsu5.1]|uniref:c-type cytochrome n=1 Tax=Caulobacter sp. UNC279MFTsu5.1 TaxID=1502775 RepID=UPI000B7F2D03|nr:cytochrome c [Caulobacter sp. UNC279MFTsu5.1]